MKVNESVSSSEEEVVGKKRGLKVEAISLAHLMTHMPKNRWCSACQVAKMQRKQARRKLKWEMVARHFGEN